MGRPSGHSIPPSSGYLFFSNGNLAGVGFAEWLATAHGELQALAAANVINKRRAEADQTASAGSPDTWIKDAVGLTGHQVRREGLRLDVALGDGTGAEIFPERRAVGGQIMRSHSEAGYIVVKDGDLVVGPGDFFKLAFPVECDLGERGFALEARVPCAPSAQVEAPSIGRGVREGGIDDVGIIDSVDKLVHAYPGQQTFFTEQAIVSRAVKLEELAKHSLVDSKAREDGSVRAELRGNEAVCVLEID